jgi:hypothetical protein
MDCEKIFPLEWRISGQPKNYVMSYTYRHKYELFDRDPGQRKE